MSRFKSVSTTKNVTKGGSDLETNLKVGHNVIHEQFGKGKVLQLEGASPDRKALIYFPSSGQKTLLLRFAKLEILD